MHSNEMKLYTKDERVAALLKQRNPAYTYNTVAATAIWLNYLSKYSENKQHIKAVCSLIEKEVSIITDAFRDSEIIQIAFFGQHDNVTAVPAVSNLDDVVVTSETLGSGGFGTVFVGKLNGKNVAVKSYTHIDQKRATKKYGEWCICMKEYALLCKLQDTGVVGRLYGVGWNEGCWRMVMERHSIRALKWRYHTMYTAENTKQIICDMFAAIRTIHEVTGYVHGDVKPENMMIDIVDGKPTVKIIDFGLSEPIGVLTKDHQYIHTIYWRSPELLDELPCDLVLADAWAAAVTAFDIMAGRCVMYELGAKTDIDVIDMSNLLFWSCLNRSVIPEEWEPFIEEDLVEFANEIYGKYIVRGNLRGDLRFPLTPSSA